MSDNVEYTCGPRLSEVLSAVAEILRGCGVVVSLGKIAYYAAF